MEDTGSIPAGSQMIYSRASLCLEKRIRSHQHLYCTFYDVELVILDSRRGGASLALPFSIDCVNVTIRSDVRLAVKSTALYRLDTGPY